jgi:hypothetical protein
MPKCTGSNWKVVKASGTASFSWGWRWSVPSYLAYRDARAIAENALHIKVLGEVGPLCDVDGKPLCEEGCECKVEQSSMAPGLTYLASGNVIGGGTWTYVAYCYLGACCEEIVNADS